LREEVPHYDEIAIEIADESHTYNATANEIRASMAHPQ